MNIITYIKTPKVLIFPNIDPMKGDIMIEMISKPIINTNVNRKNNSNLSFFTVGSALSSQMIFSFLSSKQ